VNLDKSISPQLIAVSLLTFILCATWNIPHTIGIRYTASLALIGFMLWTKPNLLSFIKAQPIFLILVAYFLIHIFLISDNLTLSLKSFNQEWLKFIIFTLLGTTIGFYFSDQYNKDFFLWIGGAFSIPLLIHLFLFLLKSINESTLPYGYSGLSVSHGDLGYTALQSSIFLSIYIFSKNQAFFKKLFSLALLCICFLSPYLAQSRGGLIFVTFSTLFIFSFFWINRFKFNNYKKILIALPLLILISFFSIKIVSFTLSDKWQDIGNRIEIGFIGDPISIICDGTAVIYADLEQRNIPITQQLDNIITEINLGTATRITVARAGFDLVREYPLGINGSKDAYQIAISKNCLLPTINMANTHNGWLDLTLALGIPGLIIFIGVYFAYLKMGIDAIKNSSEKATLAGVGLSVTVIVWLLRGILDATSRDQMLEMQAFCLALFAGIIFSSKLQINK